MQLILVYNNVMPITPSATTNWDSVSPINEWYQSGDYYGNKIVICSYDPVVSISFNSFDRTTGTLYKLTLTNNATASR